MPRPATTKAMTTRAADGRRAVVGSPRGSLGVASSRATSLAATGTWWSGRWRGWWVTGACRSATSGAPTSCSRSATSPAQVEGMNHRHIERSSVGVDAPDSPPTDGWITSGGGRSARRPQRAARPMPARRRRPRSGPPWRGRPPSRPWRRRRTPSPSLIRSGANRRGQEASGLPMRWCAARTSRPDTRRSSARCNPTRA